LRKSLRRTVRGSPVNNREKQARGPTPALLSATVRDGRKSGKPTCGVEPGNASRTALADGAQAQGGIFIVPINEKQ
jgi:hypothetical protein